MIFNIKNDLWILAFITIKIIRYNATSLVASSQDFSHNQVCVHLVTKYHYVKYNLLWNNDFVIPNIKPVRYREVTSKGRCKKLLIWTLFTQWRFHRNIMMGKVSRVPQIIKQDINHRGLVLHCFCHSFSLACSNTIKAAR